jgi:secretion/DNA translocation related TadE-like protein
MLMVGVMTVVLMFGLMGMCVAGYLVAGHRARSAADLAALSGASAFAAGKDACGAAQQNALRNDARVVSCKQVGDLVDYVVTVRIQVRVQARVAGLPTTLEVVAHAGAGSQ